MTALFSGFDGAEMSFGTTESAGVAGDARPAPTAKLSRVDGPDFICIGMPKAGTRWLYDQLQYHPDFWMPPVKEMHYLLNDVARMGNFEGRLGRERSPEKAARRARKLAERNLLPRRQQSARDLQFLEEAMELDGKPRDLDRYAALFRYKEGLLSGDVSPGYTQFTPEIIAQTAARFPGTRIMLMVRDPVAREWSHLCMAYRSGGRRTFDLAELESADTFRALLRRSTRLGTRTLPTQVFERWKTHAPKMEFRSFLFDALVEDGEKFRRDVVSYVGGDPDRANAAHADYNRKSRDAKLPMTDLCRDVLVDYFKDELKACAEVFGAHAKQWPVTYGL
jgi:hypothetical protein